MKILLLIGALFASSAYSETCDVDNYKDAIDCIKRDSNQRHGEGELPHSVGVTRLQEGKNAFRFITGSAANVTYVGVVEVHYDEDYLLYYEIERGQNVEPRLIKEFNIVDITFDVPALERRGPKELEEVLSLYIPLVGSMADFHAN